MDRTPLLSNPLLVRTLQESRLFTARCRAYFEVYDALIGTDGIRKTTILRKTASGPLEYK